MKELPEAGFTTFSPPNAAPRKTKINIKETDASFDIVFEPYAVAIDAAALFAPMLNDKATASIEINKVSILIKMKIYIF